MAATYLITGGSGFIGTHISQMLVARGDRVINFDAFPRSGPLLWYARSFDKGIVFEQGDVSNWTQLIEVVLRHRPDYVLHLAASIDMSSLDRFPFQIHSQMVAATVNVLEAMRLAGCVKRLVNFSSIGVLTSRQYEPIDCNHPTLLASEGPASGIYGAGKIAGEAFCWAYSDLYDLDIVHLRPSAAYGFFTRNEIFLNQLLEGAVRGEPVHLPFGGSLERDYTHVEDIAGIALAALDVPAHRLTHRVFYAASGMNPLASGSAVASLVRRLVPGCEVSIEERLTPALLRYEVKFRGVLDISPIAEQLGYQIRYADLFTGMHQYAETYSRYLRDELHQKPKRISTRSEN